MSLAATGVGDSVCVHVSVDAATVEVLSVVSELVFVSVGVDDRVVSDALPSTEEANMKTILVCSCRYNFLSV